MPHMNIRQLIIRHLLFFVSALILTGCATGSTKVDLSKIDAPPAGKASVFVIRPGRLSSGVWDIPVTANNSRIADLANSSYTSFVMRPGTLKLSGGSGVAWPVREITIDVAEGKTYYIAWMFMEDRAFLNSPIIRRDTLKWELRTKEGAQFLLNSTNYFVPTVRELP